MMKKKHWTQTLAGKRRLKEIKAERAQSRVPMVINNEGEKNEGKARSEIQLPDHITAYALGHCTAWLDIFARSHGVPAAALADRVGRLLQDPTHR